VDHTAGRTDVGLLIDEGRWGAFQKRVLALVFFIVLLDGFDTQTLSLALPAIIREWGVPRADFGPVVAIGFVAMAIGTYLGGNLGDRVGRRPTLIISILVFGVGTIFGGFAGNLWQLAGTRILAAIGLGAAMPNAIAVVTEYTPQRRRSLAVSIAMGGLPVGAFIGGILAARLLPTVGWRPLFFVSGILPCIAAFAIAAFLPESIRYLLQKDANDGRIGRLLRRMEYRIHEGDRFVDRQEDRPKVKLTSLIGGDYGLPTIAMGCAFFLVMFTNILIITWTPTLLADAGFDLGVTSKSVALFSIGGLFGSIGGSLLLRKRSAVRSTMTIAGLGAVTMALLAMFDWTPVNHATSTLLLAMFIAGCFIPGTQILLFSLAGTVYPTAIRGTGVGFTAGIGRFGAVVSGFAGSALLTLGSSTFFAVACAAMVAAVLALLVLGARSQGMSGT
jgi:AAHS family 4-hydroxybenzoate transporter-like MFS transporter